MSQIQFFATKIDLLPLLERVEGRGPLKYVRAGRFLSPGLKTFRRGADIPNIGTACCESASGCDRFVVCEPELAITVRTVNQSDGVRSFHVDQLHNPDTIIFNPGGVWRQDILLYGTFGSVSDSFSKPAKRLMQRFSYEVRKHFRKVRGYYVGPEAYELLKKGKRLTIAEQSPREFDLSLPG